MSNTCTVFVIGQSTTEFTFTPPDDSRNDRGTNLTFSPSVLLSSSAFRKSRIAHFRVYIDVTMDYLPTPHNLNSKIEYNLVGLANLGTTCYLNALLQVLLLTSLRISQLDNLHLHADFVSRE